LRTELPSGKLTMGGTSSLGKKVLNGTDVCPKRICLQARKWNPRVTGILDGGGKTSTWSLDKPGETSRIATRGGPEAVGTRSKNEKVGLWIITASQQRPTGKNYTSSKDFHDKALGVGAQVTFSTARGYIPAKGSCVNCEDYRVRVKWMTSNEGVLIRQ